MEKYQTIKESLKKQRAEILERLNKVENHLRHTDKPLDDDFSEQATERENDQVLQALDGNMRNEIMQIDHAIARLEAGNYGFCEYCRQEIPQKRLDILPFTNVCVNCAA